MYLIHLLEYEATPGNFHVLPASWLRVLVQLPPDESRARVIQSFEAKGYKHHAPASEEEGRYATASGYPYCLKFTRPDGCDVLIGYKDPA